MTYSELYTDGVRILTDAAISEAALDSRLLLEFICETDANTLYAHPDREISDEEAKCFATLIAKRANHIPLQHLVGETSFMGLNFFVDENVLIPRQDTEILCEEALRYVDDGMHVLDLCTGSGCIILSLMSYKNNLFAVGTDISEEALKVADKNAQALKVSERGTIDFKRGDLYAALENSDKFDVIVSNPPYIKNEDIATLMPEVRDHDPYIALAGGEDGLDFYKRIIAGAQNHLCSEGRIFLEIGYDQAAEVSDLLNRAGFKEVKTVKDYAGLDRVVTGHL